MDRLIYTSLTAMRGSQARQTAIANNLANAQTPGFRADMGFVGQVDYERWVVGGSYRWYPQDSFFSQIRVNGDWDITHQISVERMMEREIELEDIDSDIEDVMNVEDHIEDAMHLEFVDMTLPPLPDL